MKLYLVYPEDAEAGTIETLPKTDRLELISDIEFEKKRIDIKEGIDKVCISSEACLETVMNGYENQLTIDAIHSMKDKYKFRALLKKVYPSFNYRRIGFDEISILKIDSKMVIKPVKGCFGTAVKMITPESDLTQISAEIKNEIELNSKVLSERVLSKNDFLVEDFIEGEEYAIDMFFDSNGKPHIVNILYHPMPKHLEYLHMIYYTNQSVFDKVYQPAIDFFTKLNKEVKLKNITLHAEFKLSKKDIIPIEINPMRFGGMGFGNMIYHSTGVNPYQYFIDEESPNWDKIWNQNKGKNFVFFIGYNGTEIDKEKQEPNLMKLEQQFSHILNKTTFDYQNQLTFGIYTLEERIENIEKLLQINFNDYFITINNN